jgi:hypothetical protein
MVLEMPSGPEHLRMVTPHLMETVLMVLKAKILLFLRPLHHLAFFNKEARDVLRRVATGAKFSALL